MTGIENWGNGWWRWILGDSAAVIGGNVYLEPAVGGSASYQGDGRSSIYIFGIQVEENVKYATSWIPTTSSGVTRTADDLTYVGTGNIITARGTIAFDVMAPNASFVTQETYIAVPGTSGGTIRLDTNYAGISNELELVGGSAAVYSGAITVKDGLVHALRGVWQTDSIILYRDGVSVGTPAISNTPPVDPPTTVYIGQNNAKLLQANALITNLRIFGIPTLKR